MKDRASEAVEVIRKLDKAEESHDHHMAGGELRPGLEPAQPKAAPSFSESTRTEINEIIVDLRLTKRALRRVERAVVKHGIDREPGVRGPGIECYQNLQIARRRLEEAIFRCFEADKYSQGDPQFD